MNSAKLKETIANIVKEESEYQVFFRKALEKAGKSITDMNDEEKKEFFNKIDAAWDGKGEKNEGNAFGAAVVAAKKAGEDEFEVGGKTYKVEESVNEGKKRFKTKYGVGKSKYVVNYHDGVKKHKDGSDFFDVQIFKNQKDLEAFKKDLVSKGFVAESVNEASMDWETHFKGFNEKELKVIQKFISMNPKGIDGVIQMSKNKDFKPFIQKAAKSGLGESVNEAGYVSGYTVKAKTPYEFVNGAYAVLSAYLKDEELGPKGKRELQNILKSLEYMRKYFFFNLSESVNEAASRTAMEIGGLTGLNKDAVQKFVDTHNMDIEKVFQYVKKGKLTDRLNFVTAIVGTPGNPVQKRMIKMFGESVNEEMGAPVSKTKTVNAKLASGADMGTRPAPALGMIGTVSLGGKKYQVKALRGSTGPIYTLIGHNAFSKNTGMPFWRNFMKKLQELNGGKAVVFTPARDVKVEAVESVNEEKYTVIDPMGNQKGVGPKIQAISMAKRLGGEKTGHFVVANTNALKARRALEKFKGDFKNPKLKDMMMNLYYESVNEGRAFINAARKAKSEGKTEFEFNGKKYPVTLKEGTLNEMNPQLNKGVKSLLDKELKDLRKGGSNHLFAVMHILKGALTDANFHSDAKKVPAIFGSKAKYEGDPQGEQDLIDIYEYEIGPKVANICKWDGGDIVKAIGFYTSMTIGRPLGQKIENLV